MSRKAGPAKSLHEYYPTPSWVTLAICRRLGFPRAENQRWLEPCAGTGNIIRAVDSLGIKVRWFASEIRGDLMPFLVAANPEVAVHGNYFSLPVAHTLQASGRRFDVGIANPPFSMASQFVLDMLPICDEVLMLHRVGWFSGPRADLLRRDCPDVYVLDKRPSFTGNQVGRGKTDQAEYAWYHWPRRRQPYRQGRIELLQSTPGQVEMWV